MDPKFVDIEFDKQPEYTRGYEGDGRNPDLMGACRSYADVRPLIPKEQWKTIADKIYAAKSGLIWLVFWIFNQGQEGSCVGNASIQALMLCIAQQIGKRLTTILSPMSLYRWIGSSPGSGAMVDDALHQLCKVGALPVANDANSKRFGDQVHPATGYYSKFPNGWEKTAARFKIVEYLEITSLAAMVTALLNGHPVIVGRQGHSICYVGVKFVGEKMYFIYVNSWGQWGAAEGDLTYGFGYDSEATGYQSAQWCVAVCSATVNEDDLIPAQAI